MPVTKEQVLATAALARIDLSAGHSAEEAEKAISRIAGQMESIVQYMDILNHVDTTGVEPLYSPMRHVAPPRPDVAAKRLKPGEILAEAPERQGDFFAVPPVIS